MTGLTAWGRAIGAHCQLEAATLRGADGIALAVYKAVDLFMVGWVVTYFETY